jgi:hypothetical protein
VKGWTLSNTASMRENRIFNETIYMGNVQDEHESITIDLAKNIFQVCGVNENIKPQFNEKLKRSE